MSLKRQPHLTGRSLKPGFTVRAPELDGLFNVPRGPLPEKGRCEMCAKKVRTVLVVGVAWVLAMGAFCTCATAEQPEPVWREFFLLGQCGQTFEDFPDLEAEGSRILVTHSPSGGPDNQPNSVWFGHPYGEFSYLEEFFDTQWYCFGEATHINEDGAKTYRFFWKDELPSPGAIARTGPEGDVIQGYGWMRGADNGIDGAPGGSWLVVSERDAVFFDQYRPLVYYAGWFSR